MRSAPAPATQRDAEHVEAGAVALGAHAGVGRLRLEGDVVPVGRDRGRVREVVELGPVGGDGQARHRCRSPCPSGRRRAARWCRPAPGCWRG